MRRILLKNVWAVRVPLLVPGLQVGTRHGGVDGRGHGYYAAGGGHGAAGSQVHGVAVLQEKGEEVGLGISVH